MWLAVYSNWIWRHVFYTPTVKFEPLYSTITTKRHEKLQLDFHEESERLYEHKRNRRKISFVSLSCKMRERQKLGLSIKVYCEREYIGGVGNAVRVIIRLLALFFSPIPMKILPVIPYSTATNNSLPQNTNGICQRKMNFVRRSKLKKLCFIYSSRKSGRTGINKLILRREPQCSTMSKWEDLSSW